MLPCARDKRSEGSQLQFGAPGISCLQYIFMMVKTMMSFEPWARHEIVPCIKADMSILSVVFLVFYQFLGHCYCQPSASSLVRVEHIYGFRCRIVVYDR